MTDANRDDGDHPDALPAIRAWTAALPRDLDAQPEVVAGLIR